MNRTTAILLALGILLAHSLGIHRDFEWNFAGPFDSAHLAFALGENVAAGNGWTLGESGPGLQAYPSPFWVGLAWLASAMEWPVALIAQMMGLLCALILISASTRIAQDRVAGVIPPVLLVLSGTMASGAVSGTEHMTLAMLLVVAFVSFEKNHPRVLSLALALLAATRAEGLILAGVWFLLWSVDRMRSNGKRHHNPLVFLPAALIGVACCWYTPPGEAHSLYGAMFHRLLDSQSMGHGWTQLVDFTRVAISPIWMVLGLGLVLSAKISGAGARAFVLASVYLLCVVRAGGEDLPFALAFLPALPLICLVIQEIIVAALDTYRPGLEAASWVMLFVTALAASTASKFPGDVGPLSLGDVHTQWLQAQTPLSLGQNSILGRTQLQTEIRRTSEMRRVAKFLAQNLDPKATILSPWTGSLTYYTSNPVLDWFSRLQTIGNTLQRPNDGHTSGAPLASALALKPDLVLPAIGMGATLRESSFPEGINPILLELGGDSPEEKAQLVQTLRSDYHLIALPITHPTSGRATPFFVYQNLESSGRPALRILGSLDAMHFEASLPVNARIRLPQMVYLVIYAVDEHGNVWTPSPSGSLVRANPKQTSSAPILLSATATKNVRLWSGDLSRSPSGSKILSVDAQLYQPLVNRSNPLAEASNRISWAPK